MTRKQSLPASNDGPETGAVSKVFLFVAEIRT
jgi:hypothetical protein